MLLVRRHQKSFGVQKLELLDAELRASMGTFITEARRLAFSTRTAGSPHLRVGNSRMSEYQCQPVNRGPVERSAGVPNGLQLRLARALADMIAGAATLRVSQRNPGQLWPSPFVRAYNEHGQPVTLTRVQRFTAACWIIRAHPCIDWIEPHDFDLAAASLNPAALGECASSGVS